RRNEAGDAGLGPLVDAIDAGQVRPTEAADAFQAAYAAWWSDAVIAGDPVLREFSATEQDSDIGRFRSLDDHYRETTAELVALRVRAGIPARDGFAKKSEWGGLGHEIQKKRRHKSVRRLMQECPGAVRRLAPCLMMSPLSVAQYLDPETRFDMVILDEASQITACDAVGVLARANQVIVAGDPKQMPPSSFFARQATGGDDEDETDEDLESILDDLLACGMPTRHLHMHYRSRCESLIAFSNSRYYGEKLVTFPSRNTNDHALTLVRPDGHYAGGGSRHNEGEAKAVAQEVVRRLTHDDQDVRNRTIGVIAVNSQQQRLIEDLLDRERARNPEIEWAFGSKNSEPVFVKNIETVQGDERDVILFSMTYGPDAQGRVAMNFGPLNRQGGERRLNVALTRARSEMMVFSTLRPDQIDLSRTDARAVADIKHFLQFAEGGPKALADAVAAPRNDFESPLEAQIAAKLEERGWTVHAQIGVSGYRIDLGVVDPESPGRYLAGVEADGAMYHSAAGARERDKIRQAALEDRGWTMLRVWSTDWWASPGAETSRLDLKLKNLAGLPETDADLGLTQADDCLSKH
ncbi:MAG: AAA domain-containing protein, partial [Acidobacteria bacterium]|nr:AAA domain-containing protein [Acidobacteriota bacterium]